MPRMPYDPEGDRLDEPVRRALRELYAPPGGDAYWGTLEESILSRVAGVVRLPWWAPFRDWVPAGVAAAGIALLLAGLALMPTSTDDPIIAYESVMVEAAPLSVQTARRSRGSGGREATLQYLISSSKE